MKRQYNAETTTEYRAPARQASPSSDVLVPFFQAVICGVTVAIVGSAFVSLRIGALAFAVTFAVAWFGLLFDHRRLLWSIEKVTNADLDQDGHAGQPELGVVYVDPVKARQDAKNAYAAEMREAIMQFVRLVDERQRNGEPTGQRALRNCSRKRLTRNYIINDEFHSKVGDILVQSGLAARHDDNSWTLTASVEEVDAALTV